MTVSSTPDAVRNLFRVWLGFVGGIAVLTVVAVLVAEVTTTVPPWLPAALIVAVAAGATVGVVAVDRGLEQARPADDTAAMVDYRSRFFMQVALLEFIPLLGFAMAFAVGPSWIMVLGALSVVPAFWRIRPSLERVRAFDRVWQQAGHPASIERAAQQPTL